MTPFELILAIIIVTSVSKTMREYLRWRRDHRREQRKMEHEIHLAQIQAGLVPAGLLPARSGPDPAEVQRELAELRKERLQLQERVEHLETIVTSASMEVNLRLNRLMAESPVGAGHSGEPTLTVEQRFPSERVGQLFAERYELISEIGRGGMGVVYQARDQKLGQVVTLKVLSPLVSRDRRALDRFRHEASATRRINHLNVVRIYDLGEWHGEPFISMELVPGSDLKRLVHTEGPLPERECVRILSAVAEGIRAAHEQGVIHRDLKPQNVIVGPAGSVKVIDFGLAKSELMGGLTVSGLILGTPQYMSPEQIQGREIDPRSDIYSLGVIGYELRYGKTPFESESPIEASFKTLQEKPPALRTAAPDTSAAYEQLVARCLEKNPAARYQRMEEVLAELRRLA
jgi:predicted Ser/Thr protein kinase